MKPNNPDQYVTWRLLDLEDEVERLKEELAEVETVKEAYRADWSAKYDENEKLRDEIARAAEQLASLEEQFEILVREKNELARRCLYGSTLIADFEPVKDGE